MSFCRSGVDSDFYVYASAELYYVNEGPVFKSFKTARATYNYLMEQKELGKKVPQRVFDRLALEAMDE